MSIMESAEKIVADFKELQEKMKQMQVSFTDASKKIFSQEAKHLFERHPVLVGFGWTQYTPYFNDGDVCNFSRNGLSIQFTSSKETLKYDLCELDYYESSAFTRWDSSLRKSIPLEGDFTAEKAAGSEVTKFMAAFTDEQLEGMFGDHVQVIVTRDGVEVEEYNHD